nr:hypothetical protein [Xanthomonas euvesicatoria]
MAGRTARRACCLGACAGARASANGRDPARHVRSRAQAGPDRGGARPRAAGLADSYRHFRQCRPAPARGPPDPGVGDAAGGYQRGTDHHLGGAALRRIVG